MDHAECELSRDRSQRLASEVLANLPAPEGTSVGHTAADYLDQLPEPVGRRTHATTADDLLADLPDPVSVERDVEHQAVKITARLDRLQQPRAVDDGLGLDL